MELKEKDGLNNYLEVDNGIIYIILEINVKLWIKDNQKYIVC